MVLDGSLPIQSKVPVTIGHEAVGEIVSLGESVTGFSKGDKIGFLNAWHACWDCEDCARHYGQCQKVGYVFVTSCAHANRIEGKFRHAGLCHGRLPCGTLYSGSQSSVLVA